MAQYTSELPAGTGIGTTCCICNESFRLEHERDPTIICQACKDAVLSLRKPKEVEQPEIIPPAKRSVFDYYEGHDKGLLPSDLKEGRMYPVQAFMLLLQAVEKWNKGKDFDVEEVFIPYLYKGRFDWFRCYKYEIHNPFVFNSEESIQAFFALEDATELLKLYLNVK